MAKKAAKSAAKKIRITQILSPIGFDKKQAVTLRGLGLRRIRHTVDVPDTAGIRGMIHKVRHLVQVVETKDGN
ncbi:MAG: 50S ribosomal protein L30 [Acidobacteria bacterium]|nr:MAG: 50S ribosomal protein L30 [Acidobacteriota bacterium]